MFTEFEQKLLTLALDSAAEKGEIDNSAVMLLRSLRTRGVKPADLIAGLQNGSGPPIYSRPDFGICKFPWGKHKGELFRDISPSYLLWAIDWITESPERAAKWAKLVDEIQGFLNQLKRKV